MAEPSSSAFLAAVASRWGAVVLMVIVAGLPNRLVLAGGDWVQTRDGRTLRGEVAFQDGRLAVTQPGGQTIRITPEELRLWSRAMPRPQRDLLQGVKVEYFRDPQWSDFVRMRMEPAISAVHYAPWPDPDMPRSGYSVRWTGRLVVPRTDTYRFFVYHRCRISLWIDGRRLLDNGWHGHRGTMFLEAGRVVDLRLDFVPTEENADARLMWETDGRSYSDVPAHWYYMPDDFDLANQDVYRLSQARTPPIEVDLFSDTELGAWERMDRHFRPSLRWDGANPFREMSLRMKGHLQIPRTGKYTFSGRSSWGAGPLGYRLWLDDELVLEVDPATRKEVSTAQVQLERGQRVAMRMEFWQSGHWGRGVQLQWAFEGGEMELIPAERFVLPADVPRVTMVLPQEREVVEAGRIVLRAAAAVEDGRIEKVEFVSGGEVLATATEPPYTATITDPKRSHIRIAARAVTAAGVSVTSPFVAVTVEGVASDELGPGWSRVALKRGVAELGIEADEEHDGRFVFRGGNSQAAGESDNLAMVYQPLEEDGQITVRLLETGTADGTGAALAGLMLRERLTDDSPFVGLLVGPDRLWIMRRGLPGHWPDVQWPAVRKPVWLRLSRSGRRVTAQTSEDGRTWREVGRASVPEAARLYAGFTAIGLGESNGYAIAEDLRVEQRPFAPNPREGLELVDGGFLPGAVTITDEGLEITSPGGRKRVIPPGRVARVLFRPVVRTGLDRLPPGSTGALLQTGDFHEGQIRSLQGERVTINSLLFGPQRLRLEGVAVLVLREAEPPAGGWELTLMDHTRLRAESVAFRGDAIVASTAGREETIPWAEVLNLRAVE